MELLMDIFKLVLAILAPFFLVNLALGYSVEMIDLVKKAVGVKR